MTRDLRIRDYRAEDARACHELRRGAFLETFSGFLPEDAVRAGAESYGAKGFGDRIGAMETVVALMGESIAGFCSMRLLSSIQAELLYLYVGPDHRGAGIGSRLVRHAEERVSTAHPELATIFLDTVVPEYNRAFWERMGYQPAGEQLCEYPTGRIPALRLEKRVGPPAVEVRGFS